MSPQYSPLARCLRKTGALLVLVMFWLLIAFVLPAQVSAVEDFECYWQRFPGERQPEWTCPPGHEEPEETEEPEEEPTAEPTQNPTPEPTQQPPPPPPPTPQPPPPAQQPPQQPQQPPSDSGDGPVGLGGPESPARNAESGSRNSDSESRNHGGDSGAAVEQVAYAAGNRSVRTCLNMPAWIQVGAYTPGTQCQLLDGAGIGVQSIIDAGPLGAVDIWGTQHLEADICFAAWGKIIFLNATTMPRSQQTLPLYYPGDGSTCAYINQPGAVILLPGAPDPAAQPVAESQTEAAAPDPTPVPPKKRSNLVFLIKDDVESAVPLVDCRVRARQNIFVRLSPGGQRTGLVIAGRTFTALARTENWFKVTVDGAERWVSSHFVNLAGPCLPQTGDQPFVSFQDLRANAGKLSNLVFLIGDDADRAVSLEGCRVTPLENLRVRLEPAGQRTGLVMAGRTLPALARTDNWFMVALDGEERWVSAHFVNMRGSCQPQANSLTGGASAETPENQGASSNQMSSLAFLVNDVADSLLASGARAASHEYQSAESVQLSNLAFLINDIADSLTEGASAASYEDQSVASVQLSNLAFLINDIADSLTEGASTASPEDQSASSVQPSSLAFLITDIADSLTDGAPAASPVNQSANSGALGDLAFLHEDEADVAVTLEGCRISTRHDVHAYIKPAGEATEFIPGDRTLTALARTDNWFLVLLDGAGRWVGARVVDMSGGCQLQSENHS